jgi:DUF2905 family protein
MSRFLIIIGILCLLAGLLWPWLTRLGLGHLPGDFRFERDGFSFYFPLATSIVISVALSLVIWLINR